MKKKFTVEQNEKRYNEALEIAKKNYITAQDLCEGSQIGVECFKNTLESIFPELKESEDERIMKELTEFLKSAAGGFLDTAIQCKTFGKWAAWLEKQGESKNIDSDDLATLEIWEDAIKENKESDDERIMKELISFVRNDGWRFIKLTKEEKESWIAWLEKQVESKNIDSDDLATLEIWEDAIKENKEKWQLSDWFIEATSLLIQKVKRIENNVLGKDEHTHLLDWPENQREQKNKINSYKITFEDVLALECAMKTVKITKGGNELYEMLVLLYNKIHNIYLDEKQGKQEHIWNEEDIFKVQRICKYLNEAKKYYADITEVRECIDWLKSLEDRYTWKPNDEQMEALAWALSLSKNCGEDCAYDLRTLQDQLKKLRNE